MIEKEESPKKQKLDTSITEDSVDDESDREPDSEIRDTIDDSDIEDDSEINDASEKSDSEDSDEKGEEEVTSVKPFEEQKCKFHSVLFNRFTL